MNLRRMLSLLLCGSMLASLWVEPVGAEDGGLCAHHPAHTEACGYVEAAAGMACGHVHTEACYQAVTVCVHQHDGSCYPAGNSSEGEEDAGGVGSTSNPGAPADGAGDGQSAPENGQDGGQQTSPENQAASQAMQPVNCAHVCTEETGCVTKKLQCGHIHDDTCGYTEGSAGSPCNFVCEICGDRGSAQPVCVCQALCTAENINEACPVCGGAGADLGLCAGTPAAQNQEEPVTVERVQAMLDALPDPEEIPEDNIDWLEVQLEAIEAAMEKLSQEERDGLDLSRYLAVMAVLTAPAVLANGTPAEQFDLARGETYYFDLSGVGIPGKVNDALPDTTLHYVPFTYAGTVEAYDCGGALIENEAMLQRHTSTHSLFIADYGVTNVSWEKLAESAADGTDFITGKKYNSNGLQYWLRTPSVGNSGDSSHGYPANNEWDTILDKNIEIKNSEGVCSWGQDPSARDLSLVAFREGDGYSARDWGDTAGYTSSTGYMFRPVLKVLNHDTLGYDGLKAVPLKLNVATLGGGNEIKIVVKNGSDFTAPTSEGLTVPTEYTFSNWLGSDGNTYAPGESVPSAVTELTAQFEVKTYAVTLITKTGSIAAGKDVTGYTYGQGAALPTAADMTYPGCTLQGWYDNETFTGDPVTEISKTDTGDKTFYAKWVAQEQFSLAPGGTYYFDLSGAGIPGAVNDALRDTTLHYVPFLYVGTIEAYKLTGELQTTEDYAQENRYPHSLFIAEYAVTHTVSWDQLSNAGLLFGKDYTSGGVDYILRVPSVGNEYIGSGDSKRGTPLCNEWDSILDKNGGYILNWNDVDSWGQDTALTTDGAITRGNQSIRTVKFNGKGMGVQQFCYRPVLEVSGTLGYDGLKAVTLDLNGGALGGTPNSRASGGSGGAGAIQIVVNSGGSFSAPTAQSLSRPAGNTGTYLMWLGSDGKIYAPGDQVPGTVTSLTALWTNPTYTVTLNAGGGTVNSGDVTAYTYGQGATLPTDVTCTGHAFAGWYDNAAFTGTPVTAIGDTETGDKEYWAKWTVNQYTLTVKPENGEADIIIKQDYGTAITEPALTRNGYRFLGWDKTFPATMPAEDVTVTARWQDVAAPTGSIRIANNSWKTLINDITFGIFFKEAQTVTVTASDNSGEAVTIEYYLSGKALTGAELPGMPFAAYSGPFPINPDNAYVVYARLTDTSGNGVYISSDGVVLDATEPGISGVENGRTYCGAQTVTVTEDYVDTVTVNGKAVSLDGKNQFTLSPANGTQTVAVTDKAGNKRTVTATVNDGHTYEWQYANGVYREKCKYCGDESGAVRYPTGTSPKTGDESLIPLSLTLLAASAAGLAGMALGGRKKRGKYSKK